MSAELGERLTDRLRQLRDDQSIEVTDLRRLTGGASRETWSLRAGDVRLVLQRARPGSPSEEGIPNEAALLRAARAAGVPVARLVDSGVDPEGLGSYLLAEFVDGETIARKILRDDEYGAARSTFAGDCGRALAAVHAIPLDDVAFLAAEDQVDRYRRTLDAFGDPHPTFELAFRWLEQHRPPATGETVVHGDFRLGNLMVGPDGLRAVVDWEIAHRGDPMEDLGWLCTRAWRFGGPLPVGGMGTYDDLFAAYADASGTEVDPQVVRWWEVLGSLKWGIICIMQARAHLDGLARSMELGAIGRRVCENEHDLLLLLAPEVLAAVPPAPAAGADQAPWLHGRPTAIELVESVREWVVDHVRPSATGPVAFHTRVAENVLAIIERELQLGPSMAAAHAVRLASLDVSSEQELAARIRDGSIDGFDDEVLAVLAATVVDKLRVANPKWFPR